MRGREGEIFENNKPTPKPPTLLDFLPAFDATVPALRPAHSPTIPVGIASGNDTVRKFCECNSTSPHPPTPPPPEAHLRLRPRPASVDTTAPLHPCSTPPLPPPLNSTSVPNNSHTADWSPYVLYSDQISGQYLLCRASRVPTSAWGFPEGRPPYGGG